MKRILSEVLRRKDGVVQRDGCAGALRIEFIERSRNESLGIGWFLEGYDAEFGWRMGRLEDAGAASSVKITGASVWWENFRQIHGRPETEICYGSEQNR
jgi:hypothetical protein